jgi:hypothetical protein
MQGKQKAGMSRRNFLRAFGGTSTTSVVAAVAVLTPGEAEAYDPGNDETKARYRVTDHIKDYYRVNHYPAKK